jgi:hypothetical protein
MTPLMTRVMTRLMCDLIGLVIKAIISPLIICGGSSHLNDSCSPPLLRRANGSRRSPNHCAPSLPTNRMEGAQCLGDSDWNSIEGGYVIDPSFRLVHKSTMPKHASPEKQGMSITMPLELMAWVKRQAEDQAESINQVIRRFIEDHRNLFGLPEMMADLLNADAKALGLNRREYLMHLLAVRYRDLLKHGPGFEKKSRR